MSRSKLNARIEVFLDEDGRGRFRLVDRSVTPPDIKMVSTDGYVGETPMAAAHEATMAARRALRMFYSIAQTKRIVVVGTESADETLHRDAPGNPVEHAEDAVASGSVL